MDGRTDGRTDGQTENIYLIFRDKLVLLGEHVLLVNADQKGMIAHFSNQNCMEYGYNPPNTI